ncbi:endonuclease [Vibrio astriarenae]|uniref:Endonuclease n=1 Tax=Vibrio astriarenae TaxID=1481923 RepID=A0A7Z2YFH7_9VIBR|nr:endonuclease [Vibrio astriarenae]QIA65150.1 endonuclease [Vibrio astriarenae]
MSDQFIIQDVFKKLEEHYGYFDWWPSHNPFEVMVGAILVQNTNWKNVDKALGNLPQPLNAEAIESIDQEQLAALIRPSGYYNQKAIKLKALLAWFKQYDYDDSRLIPFSVDALRKELLEIKGVGNETADVILTYSLNKPSFVIDAYARRIFERYGLDVPKSYDQFRMLADNAMKHEKHKYDYFHGVLVEHGQQFCNKKPKCDGCPLSDRCRRIGV